MPVNVDCSTVVGGNHKRDRRIVGDGNEPCVMQHEKIGTATRERFALKIAVDVVL